MHRAMKFYLMLMALAAALVDPSRITMHDESVFFLPVPRATHQ